MLRLSAILLCLWTFTYSQSPEEWWYGEYNVKGQLVKAGADNSQKAFAEWNYEYGKTYNRGHTLTCLSWHEGSLRERPDHGDEGSFGPYGIGGETARSTLHQHDLPIPRDLDNRLTCDLEYSAFVALLIFEDNIRYFRGLGYSPREAYFWAYPRYNAGKNWRRFKRRGEVFRRRVRFLKTQFK